MTVLPRHERPLPSFMAVCAIDANVKTIQAFTPRFMEWSKQGIWILDLRICRSFWTAKAHALGMDTVALIRKALQEHFTQEHQSHITIGHNAGYQAVLADSPWQAVLFLNYIKDRNLGGLVNLHSPFAKNFRKELSWQAWWETVAAIVEHLTATKLKSFSSSYFHNQCCQMQRAVKRLGVATPWDLREADSLAVGRRFGSVLRDLWRWTWENTEHRATNRQLPHEEDAHSTDGIFDFANGFPWRGVTVKEAPAIARHLDDPLLEWDYIEPLLQEDLGRICDLDSWDARDGVVRLEWRVVSYDLTILEIPICFRHPHSLASERNRSFMTTTLQAYYSFHQAMKNAIAADHEDSPIHPVSPIISWQIIVAERIQLTDRIKSLFATDEGDYSDLLALENRLPIHLVGYSLSDDWLPEDSYRLEAEIDIANKLNHQRSSPSFMAQSRMRPLFIYKNPIFFDHQAPSAGRVFVERIMTKWWKLKDQESLQRDYYRFPGPDKQLLWVFKDLLGHWYIHGIFA